MSDIDRHLAEIAALWNRVERRTKEVEQFNGKVTIACINEMRYAGRRVVDVLVLSKKTPVPAGFDPIVELAVAKNYLVNADHDLTDAVIIEVHHYVQRALKKHKRPKIAKYVPEFDALYPAIAEANRIVTGSREDREARNAEYQRLADEYVPRLMDLAQKLKAQKELAVDDDVRWSLRIITWLGIGGSVASVIGVVLGFYGVWLAFNPPSQNAQQSPPAVSSPPT